MRVSLAAVAAISNLLNAVQADLHQIFVGTYSTDFIYTIEFDDETKSLSLLENSTAVAGSSWITLSVCYLPGYVQIGKKLMCKPA